MFFLEIMVFFACVLISGFFSSAEVAYTGLSINQLKRLRRTHPGVLRHWERRPNHVLATLLISNNVVNITVGVLSANMAFNLASKTSLAGSFLAIVISIVTGTILLIFGEILPKIIARQNTVGWALFVSPFMKVWNRAINPFSNFFMAVTNLILMRPQRRVAPFMHRANLRRILQNAKLPVGSLTLLNNVMAFDKSHVSHVMMPRESVFAVSIHQPMSKIIQSIIQSGYSRIPVYSGSLDNVLGVLYAKDLLLAWRSGNLVVLHDLLRPVRFVEPEMSLADLLRLLRSGHQHLVLVKGADPKAKVMGLVTIQDALEAIVGPIREENL